MYVYVVTVLEMDVFVGSALDTPHCIDSSIKLVRVVGQSMTFRILFQVIDIFVLLIGCRFLLARFINV